MPTQRRTTARCRHALTLFLSERGESARLRRKHGCGVAVQRTKLRNRQAKRTGDHAQVPQFSRRDVAQILGAGPRHGIGVE